MGLPVLPPSDVFSLLAMPALTERLSPADLRDTLDLAHLLDPSTCEMANDQALEKLYPGREHKAATDALGKLRKRLQAAASEAGVILALEPRGAKKGGAAQRTLRFVGQAPFPEPRLQALELAGDRLTSGQRAVPSIAPKVLLVTVNPRETQAVFNCFVGMGQSPTPDKHGHNPLGLHGGHQVIHTVCEMGSTDRGAALVTVLRAIHDLHPVAVIGVGVGFGCKPQDSAMGDVLVSKQIHAYDARRVNRAGPPTLRGDRVTASTDLLRQMRNADNARVRDSPGWPKLRFGLLLSGSELIDNAKHRDALVKLTGGEAIGGEMEAAGIYAAVADANPKVDWLIVKAISDWADGHKGKTPQEKAEDDDRQAIAAANAATAVWACLTQLPLPPEDNKPPRDRDDDESIPDRTLPEARYGSVEAICGRHVPVRGTPGRMLKRTHTQATELTEPSVASVDALDHLLDWLQRDGAAPLFALLGEYGMGKTVTCQRLAQEVNRRYTTAPRAQGSRHALYFDLRDLTGLKDRVPTLNEILAECLARNWRKADGEPALTTAQVHEKVREGALVIFDGLDEVLVHFDEAPGQAFTRELLSSLPRPQTGQPAPKARLLLSCRTHFFRDLREQTTHFTGEDRSDKTADAFETMTLLPFTEAQIRDYLRKAVPDSDIDALLGMISAVHNLPELAQRPYTLSLIANHVQALEQRRAQGQTVYGVTLYRDMVQSWLERDKGKHHLKPEHKLRLASHLAAALWRQGQRLITAPLLEAWFAEWMAQHADIARRYPHITPDKLEEDLRNSTFLVRKDGPTAQESGFRFAHSSMQEFFLAQFLLDAVLANRPEDWAMPEPSDETLDFLGEMMAEASMQRPADKLSGWRTTYRAQTSELLLAYAMRAQRRSWPMPRLTGMDLSGTDLADWHIGIAQVIADVPLLDMSGANFQGGCLRNARFQHVRLDNAVFTDTDARWAEWHGCSLRRVKLDGGNFSGSVVGTSDFEVLSAIGAQTRGMQSLRNQGRPDSGAIAALPSVMTAPPTQPLALHSDISLCWESGHQEGVNACAFSPDGQSIVSASKDRTLRLWDAASAQCLRVFHGHDDSVSACAFSPDGLSIVSASRDRTLRLWDAASAQCLRVFHGHDRWVTACAFSPDGQSIISASHDGTLRLWDATSAQCLRVFHGHDDSVTACAFSPDGQSIVSASQDDALRLWNAASAQCLRVFQGHNDSVTACAFSPDGLSIVSASQDRTLRLWDAASAQCLRVFQGHDRWVAACAFSPDGLSIVSASQHGIMGLWDAASAQCLRVFRGHEDSVTACAFSPDGLSIVSASSGRSLDLWDAASAQCLRVFQGHDDSVSACAFSPDGLSIASASHDGTLHLWDAASAQCLRVFHGHDDSVSACAFSPDGLSIASASHDGTLRLWDAASAQCLHVFQRHDRRRALQGQDRWLTACAFSPDGLSIVSASHDGTLRLWDAASAQCLRVFQGHDDSVSACAFSPDGTSIVSASHDGTLRLWSTASAQCLRVFQGHNRKVAACAFSPDGLSIVSASHDGTLRLWDAASAQCLRVFQGHDDWMTACAFSPDGQAIVLASHDGTLRLWDVASAQCLRVFQGHDRRVAACAFSPNGLSMVSAGGDGAMRIWSTTSAQCMRIVNITPNGLASWNPNSLSIIEASGDAWRHLSWFGTDAEGKPIRLPMEYFGAVPESLVKGHDGQVRHRVPP